MGNRSIIDNRKIIYNAVICNTCGDRIVSTHRHHFNQCSCGGIAVDGGNEYLRRVGNIHGGYIDVSLYEGQEDELRKINAR